MGNLRTLSVDTGFHGDLQTVCITGGASMLTNKKNNIGTVDGTPAVPEILKKPPAVRHGKGESEKAGARAQSTEGTKVRSRGSKSSTQQEERGHGLCFEPPPPASSGSMTDLWNMTDKMNQTIGTGEATKNAEPLQSKFALTW